MEILEVNQDVMEKCKGLLNARKISIYKPLQVEYNTNDEDSQIVRHVAFLGKVIVFTTDPLQSVAEGEGVKEAEAGREASLTITTKNAEGHQYYNDIDQHSDRQNSTSTSTLQTTKMVNIP